MSFWTNAGFEPKQDFKWQITIRTASGDLPFFYAKSVKKPSFSVNMKTYKLVNREIKQPQNLTWEPIDIVLVDSIDSRVTNTIKSYLQQLDYTNISTPSLTNTTTTKLGSTSFLTEVTIQQIESKGTPVETWTLFNPQISKFGTSELSYDSDSISTYTLTIEYDWATLE